MILMVVDFSEIGQELRYLLPTECKTKWHTTLNGENIYKLRTNQLNKRFSITVTTMPGAVAGDFVTKHLRTQTSSYPTDFVTTFSYPKEID